MIYIYCPRSVCSGGPELLHQLGYKLNLLGFDACIYYYGKDEGRPATHPHYLKYNVQAVDHIEDSPENIIIFPEQTAPYLANMRSSFPMSRHVLWWLSVDNAGMTPELEKEMSEDTDLIHFVQSYYALDYVRSHLSVPDERLFYLSDYINMMYLNIDRGGPREDVVLFNPRKGFERTTKLIQKMDLRIRWQALAGLDPSKIPLILGKAKVYIDFGNHPGKDRFPREAVACGCRIITGRRGSAANDKDIPIDDSLKIDDNADDEVILDKIHTLFDDYEGAAAMYEDYLAMIREEFHVFETDVLKVFSAILKKKIEGSDQNADELKIRITDLVSEGRYERAFYFLTVYRMNEYPIDTQISILEGYIRLGLSDADAALYMMNRLLEKDNENYEAYLIKANALSQLYYTGVKDAADMALKYSAKTEDEKFVKSSVDALLGQDR